MDKNVDYYMDLPYTIELIRDKEAGWFVRVKELRGCMSQGDTAEEALVMIQDAMRAWLDVAIEDSIPIPEPQPDEEYSGKFVVRVPRSLHRQLVEQAEREDVSLNQYINVALARIVGQQSLALQSTPAGVLWSGLKESVLDVAESQPQYNTGAGLPRAEATRLVKDLEKQMKEAVKALDFENAALLRDRLAELATDLPRITRMGTDLGRETRGRGDEKKPGRLDTRTLARPTAGNCQEEGRPMDTSKTGLVSIDAYIAGFPVEVQETLQTVRKVIREEAPEAVEKISYQMPTFFLHGNLVHFAAFAHHIGFYPTPSGIEAFQQELAAFKSSKGAVQFPIAQPLPYDLIRRIVRFRVAENVRMAEGKGKKKG